MKILYITSDPLEYSTSANMRNIALITGFIKNGHSVDTLSGKINLNSKSYDKSLKVKGLSERYWLDMGKLYSRITVSKNDNRILKKILQFLRSFLYKIFVKLSLYDTKKKLVKEVRKLNIDKKYDTIISSSDPKSSHKIAEELIRLNPSITNEWIQYWGDPFASDINSSTLLPSFYIEKEERRILKKCDKAFYVSPLTLESQKVRYSEFSKKMFFLPIPYLEKYVIEKQKENIDKNKIVLGYFGNYYSKDRNIMPLVDACKSAKKFKLILTGNSDVKLNSSDFDIYDRISNSEVKQLQSKIDVLVCICNKNGTQIPGKLYHYAATNLPILVLLDGNLKTELKEYLDKFNRFIVCANDCKEINKVLSEINFCDLSYDSFDEFDCKVIAKKMLNKGELN